MLVEECGENREKRARLRELDSAKEEVALEAGIDDKGTGSWVHCSNIHCALDLLNGQLLSIIPVLVILMLSDESNSTLGVIVVASGHVKVINEVDELVLADRSVDLTGTTLELLLKDCLQKHRVSVEVKVDDLLKVFISFCRQFSKQTLDNLCLTATS